MISELGFKKENIVECIVTTYNEDSSPNAAPMGVYTLDDSEVVMRIHTDSDTYSNLIRNKGCVINIIFDPYLFLKTALIGQGRGSQEREVGNNEIKRAKDVNAPFLCQAHAFIEAKLKDHKEYTKEDDYKISEVSVMRCKISRVVINKRHPVAVNRGLYAAIELAIRLSRGNKNNVERYLRIMRKTLSSEEYKRIEKFIEGLQ
jgi:hypothetical protein